VYIGYRSATENSFHFDDRQNIEEVNAIHMSKFSMSGLVYAAQNSALSTRPLPSATFAVDWWRGSGRPAAFIQTNVVMHALAGIACFSLLAMIFRIAGHGREASLLAGAIGAALWVAHPIQVQAVTYAVQRMTLMAALFVMLSMIAFLKARTGQRYRLVWWVLCILCILGGAISKENAWMAPVFLLLLEFGVVRHGDSFFRKKKLDLVLLTMPVLVAIFVVVDVASGTGPFSSFLNTYEHRDFTVWERLLTQPRVIAFHLSQVFWPLSERFSIAHDFVISTTMFQPPSTVLVTAGAVAWVIGGVALLAVPRFRVAGFFVLFFPIALVPESSIIPLEMVFEHRMYLPSIALAGLLGYSCLMLMGRGTNWQRGIGITSVLVVVALLALATDTTVARWKDDLTLWTHALGHAPNDARVHDNLSQAYREADRMTEALSHARRAVELDPTMVTGAHNLGRLLHASGERREAYAMFMRALELLPGYGPAHFSLGVMYVEAGLLDEARAEFLSALAYNPSHAQAKMFLQYVERGRKQGTPLRE
jgi:hypothetical protein